MVRIECCLFLWLSPLQRLRYCLGDYLLAQKLLSESAHTLPMCEANPTIDIGTNRMVILFTGIAPYRGVVSSHLTLYLPFLLGTIDPKLIQYLLIFGVYVYSGPSPDVQAAAPSSSTS